MLAGLWFWRDRFTPTQPTEVMLWEPVQSLRYIDVAQVTLYVFWIFFFGLIYYLRKEDKREGYPMITGDADGTAIGFPPLPAPKTFLLRDGTSVQAPREGRPEVDYKATDAGYLTGAPSDPIGNPLLSASGPAGLRAARRQAGTDLAQRPEPPGAVARRNGSQLR